MCWRSPADFWNLCWSTIVGVAFTERSEATRTAILSAARRLLADRGYEAMTIRAVASAVGVDPSMVMRYYGSKAGLFSAAIDPDLGLDEISLPPKGRMGEVLARHFLSRWEGDLADEALMLLLRSATTNAVAAEHVRTIFETQIAKLVGRATGEATDSRQRAALVSSQLFGTALTRYVLRLAPMVEMDAETLATRLAPVLQHFLTGNIDGGRVRSARASGERPAGSARSSR